ncbi:DUF7000 family protein [Sinomicrobium weinanense]|uniref:DUF7000 domain-containing protein n=1 Tax=Sinomicrobium weinanense TaxID=2842200 RepID=A0A926JWH1_9FLAO|nr:hypothetical protein [Sinomicrobium weinanense]MBC9798453.1 hypothetical protein [Sinomicrobium weinanense]MBU3125822.1 hypothetical protein [Sinomicrobium weinanense]
MKNKVKKIKQELQKFCGSDWVRLQPIQKKYWELLKNTKWSKEKTEMPKYSILEMTLVENPDFNNLDKLAERIETKMIEASSEILDYLTTLD